MEIYEVLDAVETASTREDKMKVIADNDSLGLRDILKVNFNKKIKLNIDKSVNWTPSETPTQSLKDITKHLPSLTDTKLDKSRATKSFKAMLEQIDPMDAQVLQNAVINIEKGLKIKNRLSCRYCKFHKTEHCK